MRSSLPIIAAVSGAIGMSLLGASIGYFSAWVDWRAILCGRTIASALICGLALFTCVFIGSKHCAAKKNTLTRAIVLRAVFGSCGMACMFYCYQRMKLADASVLLNLHPLWAYLIWIGLRKRTLKLQDFSAIAVALVGIGLVVKPAFGWSPDGIAVGILGSITIATAMVSLSQSSGSNPLFVVLVFSTVAMVMFIPAFGYPIFRSAMTWSVHNWQILLLASVVCGTLATVAQLFLTFAYQRIEPHIVGVLGLLQVPFSAILEVAGDPEHWRWNAIVGTVLVFAGCAWILLRSNHGKLSSPSEGNL